MQGTEGRRQRVEGMGWEGLGVGTLTENRTTEPIKPRPNPNRPKPKNSVKNRSSFFKNQNYSAMVGHLFPQPEETIKPK
jgi:hypothetical protein